MHILSTTSFVGCKLGKESSKSACLWSAKLFSFMVWVALMIGGYHCHTLIGVNLHIPREVCPSFILI